MFSAVILSALVAGANALPNALQVRQAVTSVISPSAAAPSGCTVNYSSTFGIAAMSVSNSTSASTCATTTGSASVAPVTQISDGQIQATSSQLVVSITQTSQAAAQTMTMVAISQINDGQIQAPYATPTSVTTVNAISQISDGQIQAPTATTVVSTVDPITQISDGQIQAPTATATASASTVSTVAAVSQISDGQIQASVSTVDAVTQISDGQIQATTAPTTNSTSATCTSSEVVYEACNSTSTLSMTLKDGVLTDNLGRTGYIASNYQFQFDAPAQAGAIYTAGWSMCSNGSLALGGSAIFYQCLSGSFYNLYDRNWAAQCSPITLQMVEFVDCDA